MEQTGDEYLKSLLASKDPDDQALAQRIIKSQQTLVVESPLDRVVDTSAKIKDMTPKTTAQTPKNVKA